MAIHFNKQLQFSDYYHILWKNKWVIAFCMVVFLGPTWYFTDQRPDSYTAYSQLAMEEGTESLFLMGQSSNKKSFGYYSGIFQGRAFQEKLLASVDTSTIPGVSIPAKREFIANNLRITPGTFNTFLKITVRTHSPDLSYELVKTSTDSLIVFCKRVENQESQQALTAIREHMRQTTEKYDEVLKDKNRILQEEGQGDIRGLAALEGAYEKQLVDYELESADLAAKQAYFKSLDEKIHKKNPISSEMRQDLQNQIRKLMLEKQKRVKLGLPKAGMDSLSRKISDLETRIQALSRTAQQTAQDLSLINEWKAAGKDLDRAKSTLKFKRTKIHAFDKAILGFKKEHPDIARQEFEMNRIEEMLQRYTTNHKRLSERLENELIKVRSQTGGLKIMEDPYFPSEPLKKNDSAFFVAALMIGLILGIGVSLMREFMNDSITGPEDIERHLALPLLGTIPHIVTRKSDLLVKRSTKKKGASDLSFRYPELILRSESDDGLIAEAYRSLRTNLLFSNPDKDIRSFLVSSCGPHDGKSLTVSNTALSFAQQGEPVLLVDADLRRPVLHHLFRTKRGPGLSDVISGSFSLDEAVRDTRNPFLKLLTAGSYLPNASEVLGSRKFQELLETMRQTYKLVLFDTPPIIAVTDACILASKLDGVVLVTRSGKTSLYAVERSLQDLKKVNADVLGCILNDVNLNKQRGQYGYYKNYYRYYHTTRD